MLLKEGRGVSVASIQEDGVDRALIAEVAAGDLRRFETLYGRFYPRIRRFLERMTRRPHLVEELINDTMLVVWRRADTYNQKSKVSTWIFAIAYNKALKALKAVDDPVAAAEEADETWSELGLPEREYDAQELRLALARALASLSADHRAVIELTYYQGYACREIAEIMACPVDTVKTRMFHARRRLKAFLGDSVFVGEEL